MKSIRMLITVGAVTFACCQKSPDPSTPPNLPGQWQISYYFDQSDKTPLYASYLFAFGSGGLLTAQSGNQSWKGTWSTGCDDSAPKMCLAFESAAPSALRELAEDWRIIAQTDTFIHLEHRSGGGGDTEVLHFERL